LIVRGAATLHRRFMASKRGVAAVEFAIMLPILVTLFLASVDAARAIAIYTKVRAATYTLDAITNQYTTIQSTDMSQILGATAVVLQPYSSSSVTVVLSQIKVSSATSAKVNWSATLNGTALTQNSSITVPTNFASCPSYPCYLVYGQVSYTYTPLFMYFTKAAFTLSDSLYATPRVSQCILYPPQSITTSPC
jgi:Flp pilus assembly protein TadG